jgi:hypothetical protein
VVSQAALTLLKTHLFLTELPLTETLTPHRLLSLFRTTMARLPDRPQYDPQVLQNCQPVIITVIDPLMYKLVFQSQVSHNKFDDISNLTCHDKIANCATPCALCKMPEVIEKGTPTASEVPLLNDEYLLAQWAEVKTASGETPLVETITDITAIKRQQTEAEGLVQKLSAPIET